MQRCVPRRRGGWRVLTSLALAIALAALAAGCTQNGAGAPAAAPGTAPAQSPAAGPTGRLAYLKGADVYIEEPGKPPIRVTQDGQNIGPLWSPDGQWLLYVKRDVLNAELWAVRSDGSGARAVDLDHAVPFAWTAVAWAPGGRTLAYISIDAHNRVRELYTVDFTDQGPTAPRRVYNTDAGIRSLAWSPDAQFLALITGSNRAGSEDPARLVRVRADGSDHIPILEWPGQVFASELVPQHLVIDLIGVSWSPSGQWLTFLGLPQPGPHLENGVGVYMLPPEPADGGAAAGDSNPFGRTQAIGTMLPYPNWLAWAPGGERAVLVDGRTRSGGVDKRLVLIEPGEPATRQVLSPEGEVDRDPAWSPDGQWVAVSRTRNTGREDPTIPAGEIWVLNPATGEQRRISDGKEGADWYPRWSADGRSLTWLQARADRASIMWAPADGSAPPKALVTDVDAPPGRYGVVWSDAIFSYHPGA